MQDLTKRGMDILLTLLAMPAVLPVSMVIAMLVWINVGTPVMFRQIRPGLGGRSFLMIKFRTMSDERGPDGALLPDAQRIGRFGLWLRSTSLDELPELLNVLRGDMSLVGPRPLLMEYLPLYSPIQLKRHEVRPGITGWAQINGRNAISWSEKFRLDIWYVENWSLTLDMKILWRTVGRVMARDGIRAENEATMPKFRGSSDSAAQ